MLPKTLKYGSKVESAMAKSSRVNIAPQNGTSTYRLGDTIILNIPTRNNLVLATSESYLKFNVLITSGVAANAFRWDTCGAHGLIQRIRVFHGSNLLQDIDNYGMLAKLLFDLQLPTDNCLGKQSMLVGTRSDLVVSTPGAYPVSTNIPAYQVNSGERVGGLVNSIPAVPGGAALLVNIAPLTGVGGSVNETYCLNLISLIGSLSSSNYFPCFACTSAPLRVEIQLIDSLIKGCADLTGTAVAPSTIALTNVEYVANFIELGDQAMSVIYGSLEGQPLQYCVPDFRSFTYSTTLGTGGTGIAMPIPAKFSSLKNLIVAQRDQALGAYGGYFPFSSVSLGLTDYQFRIGSQIMPPKSPNSMNEFFCESLKAMGSIADINYTPSINKMIYSLKNSIPSAESATSVSVASSGSFTIGLDLENYCSSPKDTIFAGYNSNTDDIFLMANYGVQAAAVTVRWDAYASFDSVLVFENNAAYVKF